MFDTTPLKGMSVSTKFHGDEDTGLDGTVVGAGGPWQIKVQWEDGSVSVVHIEDVMFP